VDCLKEQIIFTIEVEKHLDNFKNLSIKNSLFLLESLSLDKDTQSRIRAIFLDSINGYHREVLRTIDRITDAD